MFEVVNMLMKSNSTYNRCINLPFIQSRKKYASKLFLIIVSIFLVSSISAQNSIEGTYNSKTRTFEAANKNYQIKSQFATDSAKQKDYLVAAYCFVGHGANLATSLPQVAALLKLKQNAQRLEVRSV